MDILNNNINVFFDELLADLNYNKDTKAYIAGTFSKIKNTDLDLSKHSITLLYCQAQKKQNFLDFQKIADGLFWSFTFCPEYLNNASEEYYLTIAQLSYYSCYKLINRQWKLYEQLADQLPTIKNEIRNCLINI